MGGNIFAAGDGYFVGLPRTGKTATATTVLREISCVEPASWAREAVAGLAEEGRSTEDADVSRILLGQMSERATEKGKK